MLTARLNCIVRHVNAITAADIGTDHAYVPIELIRTGRAKRVIATDIRDGPLRTAEENVYKSGYSGSIELRKGNGISPLFKKEADTIIIAGMGGELICELIETEMDKARCSELILQPMNAQYELRKFLIGNGFNIIKEDIECEGFRVYNLFVVKDGRQSPFERDSDYHLPPYLHENKNFKPLLDKKIREFERIIAGLKKSKNCSEQKLNYYVKCLSDFKEYLRV